jgi:TolA-binding protein
MRMSLMLVCSLLVMPIAHAGEAQVERVTGLIPEEISALREALERYQDRVREFHEDTVALVQREKSEQFARHTLKYDEEIAALDVDERERRSAAMSHFEDFLTDYPTIEYASDVRLRLAELYFKTAEEEWLVETKTYFDAVEAAGDDLDELARLEELGEPKIDLGRVVSLLKTIIEDNRGRPADKQFALLDVAYYTLGFCYEAPNSKQQSREVAAATFRELVKVRPDSDYSDAAHLLLGKYAFDDVEYLKSIPEFEAVLARGDEHRYYDLAMYQLAWARYKLDEYDEAMRLFVEILDRSEQTERDTGKPSLYANEAVEYLALSLVDQADAYGVTPLERAVTFFEGLGERRPYRWEVVEQLARALVIYDRPSDAVQAYRYLQAEPDFRLRPENPTFQAEVVRLLTRGFDADLKAAGDARLRLTELYGEGSEWWLANRNDPEALATARGYIEASLLEVALEVMVRARESGDPAAYSLAADKYREYLDKFPIADNYFLNQGYLADALYNAKRFEEAAAEYEQLLRYERFHPLGDIAAVSLFRCREQLMRNVVGALDARFPAAEVERTYTSVGGAEITVYQLEDAQRAFIDAAARILVRQYGAPYEGIDVERAVDGLRPKVIYLMGQVLYYANRFDEARPRLEEVITNYPQTDEAAYAANLLLNSYIAENDSPQIRKWSRAFATMRLGGSEELATERGRQFQDTLEKATYQVGADASARGDYGAAAEAYLAFVAEFPKSPNVPDALLSAAFNYDRLGRSVEANQLYERFVKEFPGHPEAKQFYYSIASNYEATFQLEKAIGYYEQLVQRFPDYKDAPDALYMVAFLKEGMGDHLGAAKGYERYATQYPDVSDREQVHFRAGAMYKLVSDDAALRFYQDYLRQYGITSPDHALEAQAMIAELYDRAGRSRDAVRARQGVIELFDRIVASGGTITERGYDLAAAAAFGDILKAYDAFVGKKLVRDEKKDTDMLLTAMPAEAAAFDALVGAFMSKYLSFEYITACVYLQGSARAFYAKLGLSMEPPASTPEDMMDAYWEVLMETFFPQFEGVEVQAIQKYEAVLGLARQQRRHSEWVDKAQQGLNDLRPGDYAAVKTPLPGVVDIAQPPKLAPVSSGEYAPAPPAQEATP